ncbi:MAG: saccharopine dehydrogenase NADP-binding domain-containing protein, partial [Nitrososphaera sp.]|nr:saccharopine dehydrogenase NADP-binding domain-containing protein [Nitrososphaera sp.]
MRNILLFGAGKSATVLIEYLLQEAQKEKWNVTVADANLSLAQEKTGTSKEGKARRVDIQNKEERRKYIEEADIVISLLPPTLHYLVALDCLEFGKNLLTASYVDEQMNSLRSQIEEKKLLFLCEMGLDPGIDHMSALKMIHTIKAEGGTITSFYSHCGG